MRRGRVRLPPPQTPPTNWWASASTFNTLFYYQVLCTKLFFVLGVLWIFDFIHASLKYSGVTFAADSLPNIFFKLIEVLNLLRGCFMFLIFVCKVTVWRAVVLWWRGVRGVRLRTLESQTSRLTTFSKLSTSDKQVVRKNPKP